MRPPRLLNHSKVTLSPTDLLTDLVDGTGLIGLDTAPDEVRNLEQLVEQVEVEEIRKSLMITEGNKTKAADALGISRFTLQRKMEKYHLT